MFHYYQAPTNTTFGPLILDFDWLTSTWQRSVQTSTDRFPRIRQNGGIILQCKEDLSDYLTGCQCKCQYGKTTKWTQENREPRSLPKRIWWSTICHVFFDFWYGHVFSGFHQARAELFKQLHSIESKKGERTCRCYTTTLPPKSTTGRLEYWWEYFSVFLVPNLPTAQSILIFLRPKEAGLLLRKTPKH